MEVSNNFFSTRLFFWHVLCIDTLRIKHRPWFTMSAVAYAAMSVIADFFPFIYLLFYLFLSQELVASSLQTDRSALPSSQWSFLGNSGLLSLKCKDLIFSVTILHRILSSDWPIEQEKSSGKTRPKITDFTTSIKNKEFRKMRTKRENTRMDQNHNQ